mgnify:CR=1 FL=1
MEPKSVSKIYTLNKTTYINLRWIAILGQFLTVNVVTYVFDFEFDILIVNVVIVLGVISNIILIYFYEKLERELLCSYVYYFQNDHLFDFSFYS